MINPTWFTQAKNIRDIGSYLPLANDEPGDHERAVERFYQWSHAPLPTAVQNQELFQSHLYDSALLGVEVTPSHVRVSVWDDDAQAFADGFCQVRGLDRVIQPWPVDLVMHEPSFVRTARYYEDGELVDMDVHDIPEFDGRYGPTLVNEWFCPVEGSLAWVAEIWDGDLGAASPTIHLMVHCARASAIDRRGIELAKAFGPDVIDLWEHALADIGKGEFTDLVWTADDLADYLRNKPLAFNGDRP